MDSIVAPHIALANDLCKGLMLRMAKGQSVPKSHKLGYWNKCQCV